MQMHEYNADVTLGENERKQKKFYLVYHTTFWLHIGTLQKSGLISGNQGGMQQHVHQLSGMHL